MRTVAYCSDDRKWFLIFPNGREVSATLEEAYEYERYNYPYVRWVVMKNDLLVTERDLRPLQRTMYRAADEPCMQCREKPTARNMCRKHYQRWWKYYRNEA